jgi:hypothetical protein
MYIKILIGFNLLINKLKFCTVLITNRAYRCDFTVMAIMYFGVLSIVMSFFFFLSFFFIFNYFYYICGSIPYKDRDVKKMLETQMKGKVKFPSRTHDRLDANFISLINSMLVVDVTKRYNIDKVLKHPWLAYIAIHPPPPLPRQILICDLVQIK